MCAPPQVFGFIRQGNRVIIDDAEERFVLPLQRDPVLHRAKIIADVELARRLNAAEDPG